MNAPLAARLALWPLALAGAAALGHTILAPVVTAPIPSTRALNAATATPTRPYPGDSLAAHVQATDLFRIGHRPAAVKYDPQAGASPAPGYAPPRPALRLVGLVQGPVPLAAIAGLPGIEGDRLLGVGAQVSGFRVVAIDGGRVRVAGQDTIWVLTLRHE